MHKTNHLSAAVAMGLKLQLVLPCRYRESKWSNVAILSKPYTRPCLLSSLIFQQIETVGAHSQQQRWRKLLRMDSYFQNKKTWIRDHLTQIHLVGGMRIWTRDFSITNPALLSLGHASLRFLCHARENALSKVTTGCRFCSSDWLRKQRVCSDQLQYTLLELNVRTPKASLMKLECLSLKATHTHAHEWLLFNT